MAVSTSVNSAERQKLVDEYVELSAIGDVLDFLLGRREVPAATDSRHAGSLYGPPWGSDLLPLDSEVEITQLEEVFSQLWPEGSLEDDSQERAEVEMLARRSNLLAARLLAALAADPDYLVRSAAWLLESEAREEAERG